MTTTLTEPLAKTLTGPGLITEDARPITAADIAAGAPDIWRQMRRAYPDEYADFFLGDAPLLGRLLQAPLAMIEASADNTRGAMGPLDDLAASIRERGVLEPVVVRHETRTVEGAGGADYLHGFVLIAGHRRCEAARQAGLTHIPAIVRQAQSEADALVDTLVENLQREDPNPVAVAEGLVKLERRWGMSQAEIAGKLGKSPSWVSNACRLLDLPDGARGLMREGRLSPSHGIILLQLAGHAPASAVEQAAAEAAERDLSVRALTALIEERHPKPATPTLPLDVPETPTGATNFVAPHPEPLTQVGDNTPAPDGDLTDEQWEASARLAQTQTGGSEADENDTEGSDDSADGEDRNDEAGDAPTLAGDPARGPGPSPAEAGREAGDAPADASDAPGAVGDAAQGAKAPQGQPEPAAKVAAAQPEPAAQNLADVRAKQEAERLERVSQTLARRQARRPELERSLRSLDGLDLGAAGSPAARALAVVVDAALMECNGHEMFDAIERLGLGLDFDAVDGEECADRLDEFGRASGADLLRLALLTIGGGEIENIDMNWSDTPALDWYMAGLPTPPATEPEASAPGSAPVIPDNNGAATHTKASLLDRSPANPGHKTHGRTVTVDAALMDKVRDSYSVSEIMVSRAGSPSKVRKPFTFEGDLYVNTGGLRSGGSEQWDAYRLVPLDQWDGETLTYHEGVNPQTGYHGIEVKHGKNTFVLCGPEVTFLPKPAAKDAPAPTAPAPCRYEPGDRVEVAFYWNLAVTWTPANSRPSDWHPATVREHAGGLVRVMVDGNDRETDHTLMCVRPLNQGAADTEEANAYAPREMSFCRACDIVPVPEGETYCPNCGPAEGQTR